MNIHKYIEAPVQFTVRYLCRHTNCHKLINVYTSWSLIQDTLSWPYKNEFESALLSL
jgi:hypothetical protein